MSSIEIDLRYLHVDLYSSSAIVQRNVLVTVDELQQHCMVNTATYFYSLLTCMSAACIQCWLLLLLPTLLLAHDDCSHNCKSEANRYYYVRPEGSAETLCPAQPCLTPSQLRDQFSECDRNNSCQTANTSLVLLPGSYTSASNHWSIIPQLKFLSLTGYSEDCNTHSSATPSIDCKGTSISLMFQHIKCLHVRNCVVFTGHDTTVEVDHVTFHDSLIRLASITAADHSELEYNYQVYTDWYTLGSESYCLLQKQLADINALTPSKPKLALRNASFSSDYHTACASEYGIQLTTIHATDGALDIADCFFTQKDITHISLLHSTLHTSGLVQMENANTAILVNSSAIVLAGAVDFSNNYNSAIQALTIDTHSTVLLEGTLEFTNNTAHKGGAVFLESGNLTIADNAQVVFQGNHADTTGGAISSFQYVTIAGSVQFINNRAHWGGAIYSDGNVTIADNAQVVFQSNHAEYGGAILSFYHVTIACTAQFVNNSAEAGGAIMSFLGDVTIPDNAQVVFQGNHADTAGGAIHSFQNVIAGSVQFINNSAYWGGAIQSDGKVTIADNAQVVFQSNHAEYGGGAIKSGEFVAIAGSVQFVDKGGAISADVVNVMTIADNAQVVFQGNHAKTFGGAILSLQHVTIAGSVQFTNNSAYWGGAIHSSGNMTIADNAQVAFESNRADNAGGAMVIRSNLLELAGSVQLNNNTAVIGGAIALFQGYMTVASNARVVFQGNHAYHVGGAIYSSTRASNLVPVFMDVTQSYCFITFAINCKVYLLNNTAVGGGSAMYGISMSTYYEHYNSQVLFDIITINPDSLSAVSSDPLRVCICPDQSTPDCLAILPDQNIPHLNYTVYPGQNFTIPAAVVGFNFALTSGSVHAQFLSSDASLGSDSQHVQGVNQTGCSLLQYSVLSDKRQEMLALTADRRLVGGIDSSVKEDIRMQNNNSPLLWNGEQVWNMNRYYLNLSFMTNLTDGVFRLAGVVQVPLQSSPVYISVQLLDCPPGFTFTDQQRCDCDDRILTNLLTCNINNQTVQRYGNIWINASFSGNSSNGSGVIVHEHCPFGYCKQDPVDVDLTNPDTQCAYDRSGTLCGACKPKFSLALGGSQCLANNCSNKYLSLLIPFAVAGFALVFFIKILNFTVTQGTINGLIIYANIVAANRSVFFPAQHNKFLSFLSVFISWLNLDLGIETCFIEGLDGYWKTWLQFVFPFYVWAIAGAIIITSDYSTRATKIFGKNSHSVLATLFLLSYAKLIRSIIAIFCFTTIVHSDDSSLAVWAFDGNIHYFSRKRIPLLLFALAIVLLLWLPYTAVLLSAQWLRTQTHRKGLRWLKPFLDTYHGPFKDKHHYWVGVLLVVRGVLFVLFASFFAVESNVNLLLTIISSIFLSTFPISVYKIVYLAALENSFFLNLGVLAAGTLYIRLVGGSQEALVTTSVGIAFLQFAGITAFHTYHFVVVPLRNKCKDFIKARADNRVELQPLLDFDSSDSDSEDDVRLIARPVVTHSEVCLEELREDNEQQLQATIELHGTAEPPPRGNQGEEATDQQLQPAEASEERVINRNNTGEILLPKGHNRPEITQPTIKQHQIPAAVNQFLFNSNSAEILIPFNPDTPLPNASPLETTDAAANESAGAPKKSEAVAVPLDQPPPPPPPQESSEPPRYFAAEREERFIDFNAPRETLLEYTQYRLPQERNEPASDSISDRERELLNAPPQESSHLARYFAADREGPIDFTAPREPLLELLT